MSDSEGKDKKYRLYIRLSPEQKKEIEERAARVGISPSNYCRQRSLSTLRATNDDMAIRQLVAIGNSLNQIARGVNSGDPLAADLADTLAQVRVKVFALKVGSTGNDNDED